jgi:hypothetical protein
MTKLVKLFIYGIFNNIVSTSDCVAINDRMIGEYLVGKDMKGSSCSLSKGTIPAFS